MKESLFGKTLIELQELVSSLGLPKFTGKQIADWLYKKEISSIDEMTNLSKKAREILNEKYEFGLISPTKIQASTDGTKKYLFPTIQNKFIETAMIPERDRKTVCVSSQVGCKMGCLFCFTAKQGFQGQLSAGEIVNQIKSIEEAGEVTNIVYMGMGEPFDNLKEVLKSIEILTSEWGFAMSPRRITVSTIGIIPGMLTFLEQSEAHLAVSLHTPFDNERKNLMPVQVAYPIEEVIAEIKQWDFGRQRRVSFEYIVFENLNDSPGHVKELAKLLDGLKCRINLIRFHPVPGTPLKSPSDKVMQEFKDALNQKGILTTVRASRGQDIYAACGLLSTKELVKNQ
ncbi:23S rRNA (adenine(2503)-C(2))-methyltransferase RlmN [Maribellus comscasis]|uniref:Probable dual-specificity RNA methyltransferase RlmN n=1 Tax=Maribellus comscasis TaxID=2681766 RepID=A0A6I6JTV4_9BACT|nr:23S rRNA (adenine(2503)-C(2))-methyltransferase RlmN [Maribellus comscasis]QGY44480.1 23S rRNA (adenine(2503)-C(2))-methyltransferase RlmN [Maribellus comscasis]